MSSPSFFMEYEFKTNANGFSGTLNGFRIYNVNEFESVEKLIADCMRVLKTGSGAQVTFQSFDNGNTDLSRIYVDSDDKCNAVRWKRNAYGYVSETDVREFSLNKREVKKLVLEAIELFRDEEAKARD